MKQKEAKRLKREIGSAKDAAHKAKKELLNANATLDTTKRALKEEMAKLLKTSQELGRAEHNAAEHYQAKQAAEANSKEANRKFCDAEKDVQYLRKEIDAIKKQPQTLQQQLNFEKKQLKKRGHDLEAALNREKGLKEEVVALQGRVDAVAEAIQPATPGKKRSRASDAREDDQGSDRRPKRPCVEHDSMPGASRRRTPEASPHRDDRPLPPRRC
jgi:chromosome segregation ATPase